MPDNPPLNTIKILKVKIRDLKMKLDWLVFIILTFDNISKKLALLISPQFISYILIFSECLNQLWVYISSSLSPPLSLSLPSYLPICIYLSIYLQGLNLCVTTTGGSAIWSNIILDVSVYAFLNALGT